MPVKGSGVLGKMITENYPTCDIEKKVKLKKVGGLPPKDCRSCCTIKSHRNNPRIGRAEGHVQWKGGVNKTGQGYFVEYVRKTSKWFPMANAGGRRKKVKSSLAGAYVLQHRLVMAKHIGRLLTKEEIVHHVNGDKSDNRIENLELTDRKSHKINYQGGYEKGHKDGYAKAMKENGLTWLEEKGEWVGR